LIKILESNFGVSIEVQTSTRDGFIYSKIPVIVDEQI